MKRKQDWHADMEKELAPKLLVVKNDAVLERALALQVGAEVTRQVPVRVRGGLPAEFTVHADFTEVSQVIAQRETAHDCQTAHGLAPRGKLSGGGVAALFFRRCLNLAQITLYQSCATNNAGGQHRAHEVEAQYHCARECRSPMRVD